MEESSKNVHSVDSSGVERKSEATSPCNVINATTTSKGEPEMLSPECPNIPVPYPSPDFRYLTELYWKYPTVHQTFVVSPGLHTNQALLAKARRKSQKLKQELEKEPERHRVSQDAVSTKSKASRKTIEINKTNSRKSHAVIAATAPVQQRRRTVNMSVVAPNNKNVNVNRRLTLQPQPVRSAGRKGSKSKEPKQSDPGAALLEFRTSKGVSKTNTADKAPPVYSETPVVLDALREQREDLEKREEENNQSSNLSKLNQKCCGLFRQFIGSYRVTCVAFFVLVIIIILLCISAIVYPIARAIMVKKPPKSK